MYTTKGCFSKINNVKLKTQNILNFKFIIIAAQKICKWDTNHFVNPLHIHIQLNWRETELYTKVYTKLYWTI